MDELWRLTATEMVRLIKSREVSAREVVAASLERIRQVNPAVNALVEVHDDEALRAAGRIDDKIGSGSEVGALCGVPVPVKLSADVRGFPHSGVSDGVTGGEVVPRDSYAVANLREADGIIVGRTNIPEYTMRWDTVNPEHGRTLNPWDPVRVPGGSSGGSAVAVATGMAAIAHGSDMGGSLRQPASCCGVVTVRPTAGRTPTLGADRHSLIDSQLMSVDGPIARTVQDTWLGLQAMTSSRAGEPLSLPVPLRWAPPDRLRVRVVSELDGVAVSSEVSSAITRAADALADAGHVVESTSPPSLREMAVDRNTIVWAKIRHLVNREEAYGSADIKRLWEHLIRATPQVGVSGLIDVLSRRADHMRRWDELLEEADVYVMPVSAQRAFRIGMDVGEYDEFLEVLESMQPLLAVVITGLPVAAVPVTSRVGCAPVGVQLLGPRWREDICLAAAQVVEDALGPWIPIDPARDVAAPEEPGGRSAW